MMDKDTKEAINIIRSILWVLVGAASIEIIQKGKGDKVEKDFKKLNKLLKESKPITAPNVENN